MQSERVSAIWNKLLAPWPYIWALPWKYRNLAGGHLFRLIVLAFGAFTVAVPYFVTNVLAAVNGVTFWDPEIGLDRQIPVIGWMIAPYMALYLFYPTTLLVNPMDDRHRLELISGIQMLSLATIFCSAIFLFFPAEVDLRGQIDWESLSAWQVTLFEAMHGVDEPWNSWPSLHVAHSYFLAHAITRWVCVSYPDSTPRRVFLAILWVEFVLLSISILTTKQHYVWDLFSGLAVGFVGWRIAEPVLDRIAALPDDRLEPYPDRA